MFRRVQPRVARSPTLGWSILEEEAVHYMVGRGIKEQGPWGGGWGSRVIFNSPSVTTKVSSTFPNRTTNWGSSIQDMSLGGGGISYSTCNWLAGEMGVKAAWVTEGRAGLVSLRIGLATQQQQCNHLSGAKAETLLP